MTHDPRLPSLEQLMNGSPYELVDSPFAEGKMEAWRAQSLALGASGALAAFHRLYEMVRNDAADAATRADEAQAREALVKHLCDQVAAMQERINRLADALEARQRADEEASRHQRRFDEEPLVLPPDIQEYQASTPPAKIGDETHQPGGELHDLPPKGEELPEPPEVESDAGGVPLSYGNVPTSYVRGAPKDQAGDLPEALEQDLPEPPPSPRGGVYPQPVAISLNKE